MKPTSYIVLSTIFSAVIFSCLCISINNGNQIQRDNRQYNIENEAYKKYIGSLIISPISNDELNIYDQMCYASDAKLKIFIPASACGACAISLIQTLYNKQYSNEDVCFFFDSLNIPVINEAKIHGYKNIQTLSLPEDIDAVSILILSNDNKSPVRYIKYFDDNMPLINFLLN